MVKNLLTKLPREEGIVYIKSFVFDFKVTVVSSPLKNGLLISINYCYMFYLHVLSLVLFFGRGG